MCLSAAKGQLVQPVTLVGAQGCPLCLPPTRGKHTCSGSRKGPIAFDFSKGAGGDAVGLQPFGAGWLPLLCRSVPVPTGAEALVQDQRTPSRSELG